MYTHTCKQGDFIQEHLFGVHCVVDIITIDIINMGSAQHERASPQYTTLHTQARTHSKVTNSVEAQRDIIIIPNRYEAEHQSRSPLLQ